MVCRKMFAKNLRSVRELFARGSWKVREKFTKGLRQIRKELRFVDFLRILIFREFFCVFFVNFCEYFANVSQIFRKFYASSIRNIMICLPADL